MIVEASAEVPTLLTPPPLPCVASADGAEQHRAYMSSLLSDVLPHSSASPSATLALAALALEMLASSSPVIDAGLALTVLGRHLHLQVSETEGSAPSRSGSGGPASPHPAAVLQELVHSGLLLPGPGGCLALAHPALLQPLAACELSRVFAFAPQAALDQHFLCSLPRVRQLLGAAAIAPQHTVCELGAGIGSLARHLPPCAQLTLVDLDPALAAALRHSLGSAATVLQADALAVLRSSAWDIVVSSLPHFLTEGVLGILAGKARGEPGAGGGFVRAVLCVHAQDAWQGQPYTDALCISDLCVLHSKDFFPPQPFDSKAILVTPRGGAGAVRTA